MNPSFFLSHAGVRFRGFSNPEGKILGVFDFHGGEILGLKKSYGCKEKNRRPKILVFFWCIIKISVGKIIFLTCQEVKYLAFTNLAGVSFREN